MKDKNDDLIEQRAYALAVRLTEIPMWDLENIQEIIVLHIKDIQSDCTKPNKDKLKLELRRNELEEERQKYKQITEAPGVSNTKKIFAQRRLTAIKLERKKVNIAISAMEDREDFLLLQKFIKNKFGENVLQEFWESLNRKNKINNLSHL